MDTTTDLRHAYTATGRFGHLAYIGATTTLCGEQVVQIVELRPWETAKGVGTTDCRNCNAKAFGTRRTR
jgi:hypothetical protein